jgi:hypothetical protein
VLSYVLFDCVVLCIVMCVNVYYCHRVSTQLQLNISASTTRCYILTSISFIVYFVGTIICLLIYSCYKITCGGHSSGRNVLMNNNNVRLNIFINVNLLYWIYLLSSTQHKVFVVLTVINKFNTLI